MTRWRAASMARPQLATTHCARSSAVCPSQIVSPFHAQEAAKVAMSGRWKRPTCSSTGFRHVRPTLLMRAEARLEALGWRSDGPSARRCPCSPPGRSAALTHRPSGAGGLGGRRRDGRLAPRSRWTPARRCRAARPTSSQARRARQPGGGGALDGHAAAPHPAGRRRDGYATELQPAAASAAPASFPRELAAAARPARRAGGREPRGAWCQLTVSPLPELSVPDDGGPPTRVPHEFPDALAVEGGVAAEGGGEGARAPRACPRRRARVRAALPPSARARAAARDAEGARRGARAQARGRARRARAAGAEWLLYFHCSFDARSWTYGRFDLREFCATRLSLVRPSHARGCARAPASPTARGDARRRGARRL